MRAICDGTADVPQAVRAKYLKRWGLTQDNVEPTAKDHAANRYARSSMEKLPTPKRVKPWRKPGDRIRGLGDVLAWLLHLVGIRQAVKAVTKATGRSCGCQQRQDALNRLVPFQGAE